MSDGLAVDGLPVLGVGSAAAARRDQHGRRHEPGVCCERSRSFILVPSIPCVVGGASRLRRSRIATYTTTPATTTAGANAGSASSSVWSAR